MGELTADKLLLFVLMALPGAIAIRVYALWCPTAQKDWKESLTDAVIYSVVGLTIWVVVFPWIVTDFVETAFGQPVEGESKKGLVTAFTGFRFWLFAYTIGTPVILATVWYHLRLHFLHRAANIDHPKRTAWDWVFSRRRPFYLLVYLKTKNSKGIQFVKAGYFGGNSYVTSYPHEPEIYFERVHELTPDGGIGLPVEDTDGMLIRHSEIDHLEFFVDRGSSEQPYWYMRCAKGLFVHVPVAMWRYGLRYIVIVGPVVVFQKAGHLMTKWRNRDGER